MQKFTVKKPLLDCATKTAFFYSIFYEQTDSVSMGCSLGPVLANIILTEFDKANVDDLIKNGTIAFHYLYVDDTLVLIKPKDIPFVFNKFNSFDKNLKFTVDNLENGKIHF